MMCMHSILQNKAGATFAYFGMFYVLKFHKYLKLCTISRCLNRIVLFSAHKVPFQNIRILLVRKLKA